MSPRRTQVIFVLSLLVLAGVGGAWFFWPTAQDRADLVEAAPEAVPTTVPVPSTSTTEAPPSPTTTVPVGIDPTRLRIESLGVDASVVRVGLEPDGQMEIPNATEVGWYELGPRPGEGGSAVLAAHVDSGGQRGAFFDLASLQVGAEVVVEGDGASRRFRVTAREQIAKADVQLERYFTAEGPRRLTLITCGGVFDRSDRHYQDNIIITAEPVAGPDT